MLLLAALAINKELDLHTGLTAYGRCLSNLQGWNDIRRQVQLHFALALFAGVALAGLVLAWRLASVWRRVAPAALGLALIAAYALLRASAFAHVGDRIPLPRPSALVEPAGATIFALRALHALRSLGRASTPACRHR